MKKFKKYMAVTLAMVLTLSTSVMALAGITGEGGLEGTVDTDVYSVILPTEAENVYMKLRKENKFKATYSLSYNDYTYSNKILKSSIIIKYKVNDTYCIYISNAPLYVFPGYSKNYAMERYIDEM